MLTKRDLDDAAPELIMKGSRTYQVMQKRTPAQWRQIGASLLGIQRLATQRAGSQSGATYVVEYRKLMDKAGFGRLDKGDIHRIIEVCKHYDEIEAWARAKGIWEHLSTLHPSNVYRAWQAAKKEKLEGLRSPVRRNVPTHAQVIDLENEVERLRNESRDSEGTVDLLRQDLEQTGST
jgi:hypothetical protein